jgi:hypothetical protein
MSDELKNVLDKHGITKEEMTKVAGPDGQIKAFKPSKMDPKNGEFGRLFKVVDKFDLAKKDSFELRDISIEGEPLTPSGEIYEALKKEVATNRLKEQYGIPGSTILPDQDNMSVKNAVKVDKQQQNPKNLRMDGVNQILLHPDDDKKAQLACMEGAMNQAVSFNEKTHGKNSHQINSVDQAIQVAYAEDLEGRVKVDKTQMNLAQKYIDQCLDQNYPVVVGVSSGFTLKNHDQITDHFVTIHGRGYDKNGELFYEFRDPGNSGNLGKFYVDKDTGKFFKEGASGKKIYTRDYPYEMTQVRTYNGIK